MTAPYMHRRRRHRSRAAHARYKAVMRARLIRAVNAHAEAVARELEAYWSMEAALWKGLTREIDHQHFSRYKDTP